MSESDNKTNRVKHSFYLTEKQEKDLLLQAQDLGVDNIPDFLDKAIHLAKIYSRAIRDGFEMTLVNRNETDTVANKKTGKIAVVGPPGSIVNITEKLEEAMGIHKKIKNSNAFGLPVDGYKA